MKEKVLAVLLTATMCISVASCGNDISSDRSSVGETVVETETEEVTGTESLSSETCINDIEIDTSEETSIESLSDELLEDDSSYSEGLEYSSMEDGTATVSGIGTCEDVHIVIPPVSPDGEVVTKISGCAFEWNSEIESVIIPEGVTEISQDAFANCTSLTMIVLPDSLVNIGSGAFMGCTSLPEIEIPESVTVIPVSAFIGCSSLTHIELSDNITSIGRCAFGNCSSLTTIELPDSFDVDFNDGWPIPRSSDNYGACIFQHPSTYTTAGVSQLSSINGIDASIWLAEHS